MPISNNGGGVPPTLGQDGKYLAVVTGHPAWAAASVPAGALQYQSALDCHLNPNYPAATAGYLYNVSVAGKIGGASGPDVEVNDMLLCRVTSSAGSHAAVGANWTILQTNIEGAVTGPASATDGAVALFDGITGNHVKNSTLVANPLGALHQVCADDTPGDGWNIQQNGFFSEADSDCDSGFVHTVDGTAMWAAQTFRGENGQFWYLYTPEAKQNPITLSDGGRMGINKPTNNVNYHTNYVNPSTGALNDMDATGTYTRPFNTLYEVAITSTGSPDMFSVRTSTDDGATWSAYSTPAACPTTFTPVDVYGVEVVFGSDTGHNTDDAWRFTAFSQLPSAALTVNPTMFIEVNNTTDGTVASPSWNDITFDMADLATPEVTFLPIGDGASAKGMVYMGCHRKFNSIFVDVITPAVGASMLYEYWNGSEWTGITGLQGLLDQTVGLTASGQIRWDKNLMTGWAQSVLPGKSAGDDGYTLFWVRMRSSTVMSQAPTADLATPQGNMRFAVYPGHLSSTPTFSADGLGKVTLLKKPGTVGSAFTIASLDDQNYKVSVSVEHGSTGVNIHEGVANASHKTSLGYGRLSFATVDTDASVVHGFDKAIKFYTGGADLRFVIDGTGALTAGTVGYEALVQADNDIPNKKYVDQLIGGIVLQGDWNANTNTPDITGTTTLGYAWNVTVEGATNLGGITDWRVGDLAVKTAGGWSKVASTTAVWGNISGTLANQGDLQGALNAKVSSSTLASWAGTSNITTVGTVGTGTWQADRINKNYLDTTLTAQGNTFNGASQLVQMTAGAKLPAVDGSLLTELQASATVFPGININPAYELTLDNMISYIWSSGQISGFALTDNGDGTVDLDSGVVMLRASDTMTPYFSPLYPCQVNATADIPLTDNTVNYVYAQYHATTPLIGVSTDITAIHATDKVLLYIVTRVGTHLDYINCGDYQSDFMAKYAKKVVARSGNVEYAYGALTAETGTRKLYVGSGAFYFVNEQITTPIFDTSASDTFTYIHRAATPGTYTRLTDQTTVDNGFYDDGSGTLAALGDGQYGVHWVYLVLDEPTRMIVVYGRGSYADVASATAAGIPASMPPECQKYSTGTLIAKIIVRKDATNLYSVSTPFDTHFITSTPTTHNGLNGLQGGMLDQYWHMTTAEHTMLQAATDANTASALVRRAADGSFSAGVITASLTGTASKATNLVGGNGTTLKGSMPYQSNTDTTLMVGPNTTLTKKFLRMTGDGTNGAVPAWDTIVAGDVPTLNQDTTGSAVYWKASATTGKLSLTGPTTGATRAKTVRDADDTILELGGSYAPSGTWTSMTLVTPALGTPASGNLANCTFPTLNQDTSGSATYLKALSTTGKVSITGPTTGQTRAKTLRDADDTILELGGSYTPSGTWTSMTLVTPALGTPASGNLANCTFPTLNQDTSGTAAKATNMKGGNSTTLLGSIGYQSDVDTTTLLGPNTAASKKYLTQTGTGTNGAVPAWDVVTDVIWPVTTKTDTYPITAVDVVVLCDTTARAFTVTLPTAVNAAGKTYVIKRVSAGTNRLTVATTSSQTIDGQTTALVDAQWNALKVVSDGANWFII